METVIFDLDGTLANIDKRRALATKPDGKIDWDVFFAPENIKLDEPNHPVIKVLKALTEQYCIVIFSGRDDISANETIEWLASFGIYPDMIKMRRHGSYVPDDKLKKLWLDDLRKKEHNIICAFDDRDKVVKMWRDNGVPCFQVAEGNF
jgi:FMN phosphatase YigB (HAD superfamily)